MTIEKSPPSGSDSIEAISSIKEEVDLLNYIYAVFDAKWFILLVAIVAGSLSTLYAKSLPETFQGVVRVDVIDLSAGDADLAPPPAAVKGLQEAVENPAMSRYPFNLGLAEFREEVSAWMGRRFGVEVDPGKEMLLEIVSMVIGLIRANSEERSI